MDGFANILNSLLSKNTQKNFVEDDNTKIRNDLKSILFDSVSLLKTKGSTDHTDIMSFLKQQLDKLISARGPFKVNTGIIKTSDKELNIFLLLKEKLDKLISNPPKISEKQSNLIFFLKKELDELISKKIYSYEGKLETTNESVNFILSLKDQLDSILSKKTTQISVPANDDSELYFDLALLFKKQLDQILSDKLKIPIAKSNKIATKRDFDIYLLLKNELDKIFAVKKIGNAGFNNQIGPKPVDPNPIGPDSIGPKPVDPRPIDPSRIGSDKMGPKGISRINQNQNTNPKISDRDSGKSDRDSGKSDRDSGKSLAASGTGSCDEDAEICRLEYSNEDEGPLVLENSKKINMESTTESEIKEIKDE